MGIEMGRCLGLLRYGVLSVAVVIYHAVLSLFLPAWVATQLSPVAAERIERVLSSAGGPIFFVLLLACILYTRLRMASGAMVER